MREWPSIVPGTPEDYFIVINHFGRFGTAFAETDLDRANFETIIADLMSGQHADPLRVIMFNPETNRSEDVSHAIAQVILRRLGLEDCDVPSVLEDFIDCQAARSSASAFVDAVKNTPQLRRIFSGASPTEYPERDGFNVS
jgi:hypothetical protein